MTIEHNVVRGSLVPENPSLDALGTAGRPWHQIFLQGTSTQLQYNNAGALAGISGAMSDGSVVTLTTPTIDGLLTATTQTTTVGALTGTLTNAPVVGNPAVWLRVKVNGTTYAFPGWALA